MCGRFALYRAIDDIARRLGIAGPAGAVPARYNITPGGPILMVHAPERQEAGQGAGMENALWGFRPAWAGPDSPAPINARAERVATSPYFREAFARRRCLIPASGWYEWRRTEAGKQPFYFTHANGEPLMFAGLWTPAGEGGETRCAIITEPARGLAREVHPRMPLVLDESCWEEWLDPAVRERDRIRAIARHLDVDALTAWAVSRRVNRPDNDDEKLIWPAEMQES